MIQKNACPIALMHACPTTSRGVSCFLGMVDHVTLKSNATVQESTLFKSILTLRFVWFSRNGLIVYYPRSLQPYMIPCRHAFRFCRMMGASPHGSRSYVFESMILTLRPSPSISLSGLRWNEVWLDAPLAPLAPLVSLARSPALQFSDHELVRRASTEALCNLMPHPKMVEHLKRGDTLKLFAAFCQLGPEDPPTAVAAMGCIAMGVADKEVGGWYERNRRHRRSIAPSIRCRESK